MVVLGGGAVSYERGTSITRLLAQVAVERMWHTQDSQGQILALAFR